MAPIVTTIEISRSPQDVFPFVTDPASFPEWQHGVVRDQMNEAPVRVGSRCTTVRRIGGREREMPANIRNLKQRLQASR